MTHYITQNLTEEQFQNATYVTCFNQDIGAWTPCSAPKIAYCPKGILAVGDTPEELRGNQKLQLRLMERAQQ